MPAEGVQFKPRSELLTFEEIERFVRVVVGCGVTSHSLDREANRCYAPICRS